MNGQCILIQGQIEVMVFVCLKSDCVCKHHSFPSFLQHKLGMLSEPQQEKQSSKSSGEGVVVMLYE